MLLLSRVNARSEARRDFSASFRVLDCGRDFNMRANRLLLWDIDGTLINTGAAGQHALVRATIQRFGGNADLRGVEIAGRTDTAIAHQVLEKYGEPVVDENGRSFLNLYLDLLVEELPLRDGRVLPGVHELVETASRQQNTTLGLLTGNLRRGAQL